ncbi:uncharacterized protein EDB91DRAFT_1242496 [Suillus paluster]|uniref:uncharacterized protein n=1 Tax=Suillus paluster TaxID=48578 RepID=UPI001B87D5D4|nr:uncharacterized protein EDB91DRAFT_1242496 [Suillus paluster]KAG1755295.1 hypothetical protein EDB91DRAFT_1242496 [Suillus paluster]
MATKRQQKGKGKTTGTTAIRGGSDLHLDTRPVEALAPKHDIGKKTQKLDSEVARCRVGVAWIDLLEIGERLRFGVYNDRAENEAETNKLVASFKASGIVPMKETSAIPLILDVKRIKNAKKLANDFNDPEEVPELKLNDIEKIVVASGQHRLSALRRYHQSQQDEYQTLEKKRNKIMTLKHPSEEHVLNFNEMRTEMCGIQGVMEGMGKWGVIVYDQGERVPRLPPLPTRPSKRWGLYHRIGLVQEMDIDNLHEERMVALATVASVRHVDGEGSNQRLLASGDELACHLSRNNPLHEYKETEEEVLITILKKLKSAYDTSPKDTRDDVATKTLDEIRTVQDKNSRVQKVLHHDGLCMFLSTRLLQLGLHFRRRSEFSVTWLSKAIDVCMGVYLCWIEIRTATLKKLGSHKDFPSYKTVADLLDDAEAGDQQAIAEVEKLRKSINETQQDGEEGDLSMWAEVMQSLDNHAKTAFAQNIESIGQMTPKYVLRLSAYRQNAIMTLQDAWSVSPGKDYGENEILQHLDRVVARVAIHLTPKEGDRQAPEPLLGGMMMDYAWTTFSRLQEGIAEMCRWFEVLLDSWRIVHPKSHTMDDWSTVMLANIARDPRFTSHSNKNSRAVTQIIWKHRNTLMMRLTNYMTNEKMSHAPRPKDKKELDSRFAELSAEEIEASDSLTKVLQSRRSKTSARSRDLAMEPQSITGMMALHTTGWDWQSSSIKNTGRDIEPCMKAIAVECKYMETYRPKLLKDKLVGAIRRLLEVELGSRVRKMQIMDEAGKLRPVQEWVWWDGLTLRSTQLDAEVVLQSLQDNVVRKQQQTQARLVLEQKDREAINKAITYLTNLPCVRASDDSNSLVSHDVMGPLKEMIRGIEVNSARKRFRTLNGDSNLTFDLREHDFELGIELPDSYQDPFTIGYNMSDDEDNEEDNEDEPDTQPASKSKGKQRAIDAPPQPVADKQSEVTSGASTSSRAPKISQSAVDSQPQPESEEEMPHPSTRSPQAPPLDVSEAATNRPNPVKPIPKPRPIPRKQSQRTAVEDDNVSPHPDSMAAGHDAGADMDEDEEATPRLTKRPLADVSMHDHDASSQHATDDTAPLAGDAPDPSQYGAVATVPSATPATAQPELFEPDEDTQGKPVDEDTELDSEAHTTDVDRPSDDSYELSQPLSQPLPPRKSKRRVVPASPKRSHAATGASSSSSSLIRGRGRPQKKKPKIIQGPSDDEDDQTIIPI